MKHTALIVFYYFQTLLLTSIKLKFFWKLYRKLQINSFYKWLKKESPYYKNIKSSNFYDLPIIDKKTLMDNFNSINTKHLSIEECFRVAIKSEGDRDFSPMVGNIAVGLSSGTSGTRGLFATSEIERAKWAGIILAKVLPKSIFHKQKIALFLRANNNLYSGLDSKKIIFKFFDLINSTDNLIKQLLDFAPDLLVAPPSMLRVIATHIKTQNISLKFSKIISVAEVLDPIDQDYLQKIFQQKIHQIYQCTEGFLASTCKYGRIHMNEEFIHLEKQYLDASKTKFIPIITDLNRTTGPIVRYRLNDILSESHSPCPCGNIHTSLKFIEGREDDMFFFKDQENNSLREVFPDFIRRTILIASENIIEYKVVQKTPELIHLYIKSSKPVEEELKEAFSQFFEKRNLIKASLHFFPYESHENLIKMKRIQCDYKI